MLPPRSRALVVLLGSLTGLTALSIDMSLPSLPTLSTVFAASADQTALTLSMFLAGYSVSQLFYGPIADRFGRRGPLLFGVGLFAVGGLGFTLSGSMLMSARASTPRAAKSTAATYRTTAKLRRSPAMLPSITAGTSAISMPRVVPITTGTSWPNCAASAAVASCVLSPISARKNAIAVVIKAPPR